MAIEYDPSKILKKVASKGRIEKLVSRNLTLNRAAVTTLEDIGVLPKKDIQDVALKVIRNYRDRVAAEVDDGTSEAEAIRNLDKSQLVQRVQNAALQEISATIKEGYAGEFYEWLPSDAAVPDPEHQLNYGRKFQIGVGEMPGERFGCRCGMRILVPETKLGL